MNSPSIDSGTTSVRPVIDLRYGLEIIAFTLLYYLSARIGLYLQVAYSGITPIWPPSGIAVAVFWVRGIRYWPMTIAGEFLIALTLQQPPVAGIVGGSAQTLEAALVVCFLKPNKTKRITSSAGSVLWFSGLGVLIPPLFSATIGSSTLWIIGFLDSSEYLSGLLTWWLGDAIGILVLAPILVDLRAWPFRSRASFFHYVFFSAFTVAICLSIIMAANEKSYYLFFILLPFVVVSAVHFRLIGAGSSTVFLTIIVFGMRPQDLAGGDFITTVRMAFVGTCAFTGYLVTGFMEKRQQRLQIIHRQNSYLNSLHELILGLVSHLKIDKLLEEIVSDGCELLNTENGYLFKAEKGSPAIHLIVGKGIYGDIGEYTVKPGDGVAGKVWTTGRALMINDYQEWEGRHPDALWDPVTAIIGVPIIVDSRVVGVLGMLHTEKGRRFTDDDLNIIRQFGELASVAWNNALMYSALSDQLVARQRAEKSLAVSERTYREIFNSTGEAMFVLNRETGVIVRANKAAEEMFGSDPDDAGGRFFSLVQGSGLPYAANEGIAWANQHLEKGPQVFEWHSGTRMGKGEWFEITLKNALIEDVGRILAVARNIDDRKKTEKKFQQLMTAIEFVVEDIMITDLNGKILYVNPGFERTTGYSRKEVLGKNQRILKSGIEDSAVYSRLRETVLGGRVWTGRMHNKRKDGGIILQEASVAPIRDDENAIAGFVSVKRDITEQEKIKQQLIQSQKMEAIGTLASGIAHDFNNILAGIIGYSELTLNFQLPGDHPAAENIREILRAGQRAAALVKQILTFSHSTEVELKPIDIKPIAKEVINFASSSLPSTITIDGAFSAVHSHILASPTYIHQILMNLVTNAMQALPEEKGNIKVRLSNTLPGDRPGPNSADLKAGEYLEISVADTGCGMDRATAAKIFEPYFTTKAPGKGTGLGLSVVHGIVKNLGGTIKVDSDLGKGATFRICLPVADRTEERENLQDRRLPGGDEAILFVDDNPLLTDITTQMLGKLGYSVTVFGDSTIAIEHFKEAPEAYHLVITDMLMPKMTGIDLGRAIKTVRPEIPIIICTGNPAKISPADVKAIGISEVAKKPLNLNELAVLIRNALD